MTKHGASKAVLAVTSFVAFSALTAYFAARGAPGDATATTTASQPARIVVVRPNGDTETIPAPEAAAPRPVTRTRGS
ncbi:MAG TPA: hypothetical protein VNM43_07640 [Dehalococcoidia bacterium]|nr:hypothetical protein [Dehalococcoidia bacterium]